MKWICIIAVTAGMGAAAPAWANTGPPLAKECRAMALQAHPATLPHIPAVTNLRNSYYDLCLARRGRMDQELAHAR